MSHTTTTDRPLLTTVIRLRLSEQERETVRADAARAGLSLSDHIRTMLLLDTVATPMYNVATGKAKRTKRETR